VVEEVVMIRSWEENEFMIALLGYVVVAFIAICMIKKGKFQQNFEYRVIDFEILKYGGQ
jgi:hypothetical protein